jgi:hypothetical protein
VGSVRFVVKGNEDEADQYLPRPEPPYPAFDIDGASSLVRAVHFHLSAGANGCGRSAALMAKRAIIAVAKETTDPASSKFVPPEARIATFDQDGTLWVEHPMYTQLARVLRRQRRQNPRPG